MAIVTMTGTGTDVGKTIATAAFAIWAQNAGWRPVIIKPLQTGEPEGRGDAPTVARLTGISECHTLYRYPEPLAPATAARRAGMPTADLISVADDIRRYDAPDRLVIVEGAGGLLVRLGTEWTIADLAHELDSPLIVVTRAGLGTLSDTELTVEACQRRGLAIAGLIVGSLPPEPDIATQCNMHELGERTGQHVMAALPAGSGALTAENFRQCVERLVSPTQVADYLTAVGITRS